MTVDLEDASTHTDFEVIEFADEVYSKSLSVRADNSYHVEQYEIFAQDY